MQLKLEEGSYNQGYGSVVICPSCGGTYIHHDRIEVFDRSEDSNTGLHVTVAAGKATTDTSQNENPSLRRDGISIHFWCENCDAKPVLNIVQHKGQTMIDFLG